MRYICLNLLVSVLVAIWALPAMSARLIGPIARNTQAKADATASLGEPIADEDWLYEDDRLVVWFDTSCGGFIRGVWMKHKHAVLRSRNATGQIVPANLLFGGGYQLLANLSVRPDSPYENFMIFHEHAPRPGLPGRRYVNEAPGYTEVGFIGQLRNTSILSTPGFDPNRDPITPDKLVSNPYIAQSWPRHEERWVHVATDQTTRQMRFERMAGDGSERTVSYRFRVRIPHNAAKLESQVDVFLRNRPPLDVILMVLDTFNEPPVRPTPYTGSLGVTGLNTARFDADRVDNWLGIPAGRIITHTSRPGQTITVRHTKRDDYPGNGATSFVVFRNWLRKPEIVIFNGDSRRHKPPLTGLDVTIHRQLITLDDVSHMGFTATPWHEQGTPAFWWISNEVAFRTPTHTRDLEVRSLRELVEFRMGRP